MPKPRGDDISAMVGTKIYTIGGDASGNIDSSVMEVFDTSGQTQTDAPSMPTARSGMAGNLIGDKIYVLGGTTGSATNRVEVYDTSNNIWTTTYPSSSVYDASLSVVPASITDLASAVQNFAVSHN